MKPKKSTDKHIKLIKEKYAESFTGKRTKEEAGKSIEAQAPLFGEKDQLYNTLQEEISIVVAAIEAGREAISKKEDQVRDLIERKNKLEKAASTAAKYRDEDLEKKKK